MVVPALVVVNPIRIFSRLSTRLLKLSGVTFTLAVVLYLV